LLNFIPLFWEEKYLTNNIGSEISLDTGRDLTS